MLRSTQPGSGNGGAKLFQNTDTLFHPMVSGDHIPSFRANYKVELRKDVAVEYVSREPMESARELFDEDGKPIKEEQ